VTPNFAYSFPPYSITLLTFTPPVPVLSVLPGAPLVFQLHGQPGVRYFLQTSTNLMQWTSVATNTLTGKTLTFTNPVPLSIPQEFWRALWQL
jgi:hypothetical protein